MIRRPGSLDHIPGPFKRLRRWWFRRRIRKLPYQFFRLSEPIPGGPPRVTAPRGGIVYIRHEDTP